MKELKNIFVKFLYVITILIVLVILFSIFGKSVLGDHPYSETILVLQNIFGGNFWIYLVVGFIAQIIDGALGMAYGVSSSTFLLSTGVPPAVASASVHVAEVFTTGASGLSHRYFGNIDRKLFLKLAIPGAIGAATGAYILSSIDGNIIKPYVAAYLALMGIVIILKSLKKFVQFKEPKKVTFLAFFGGLVDNLGGGGWGPVVTTTLLGGGTKPRFTIGSVNASEFFVALAGASVFTILIGIDSWQVIVGLIVGGIIAAPIGAYVCSRVNAKLLMIIVGVTIILLSVRTLITSIF